MPNYPDAAALLVDWAKGSLPAPRAGLTVNACHDIPTNLAQVLATGPCHVIERVGGADRLPGLDVATVAVDTFGEGRTGTLAAAETLRRALIVLRGRPLAGVMVSQVATISAPTRRRFDSRSIVLVTATYQVTLHSAF